MEMIVVKLKYLFEFTFCPKSNEQAKIRFMFLFFLFFVFISFLLSIVTKDRNLAL